MLVMLATMTWVSSSYAGLLNVTLTFPKISYNNVSVSALNYTPTNQLLSISATPTTVLFANAEPPRVISGTKSLQIQIKVDNTGALVGGVPGNDFSLSGTVTEGTNTYSGVLLTGEVTGFGFLESGDTDLYDLQFTPTGGALAGLLCGDIGVQVTSGTSTFNNDFTTNFHGQAKGTVGALDHTPPTITCPTNIVVESQAFAGGLPGAYVSYPTPVLTDNCDPNPTVVCTPPSGSFFALPPSPFNMTNYVVTCVAKDAAGNSNVCTFTITVEDTLPPEWADTNNPVISDDLTHPIILTNDTGVCYATFTFAAPEATDNAWPIEIGATASAIDQNGANIPLTDLGNGMLQGQFPVTCTGMNVITVTADDGRGNTTQHQVGVLVVDNDPPAINCPTNQVVECTGGQIFFEEPIIADNCPNVTYFCTPTNGSYMGLGSHAIVCTATDCSGNTNQCTFNVTVQDTTPPTISCPSNVTVECGQPTDPSSTGVATASDTCDSSPVLTFTDAVSGNCPQIIARTWTATDYSGNSNACVQIITIQDTTPPVITCPPDKQLQCGDSTAPANTGTATATDNCSGNVTITFTDAATPANCTGNAGIDRTWKATDACGNSSTCVQHITFVDTTAPTITSVPTGSNLGCNPATLPTDASVKALVTATDNCGTPTVTVAHADVTTGCTVTRTFTVTAADACGNATTPQAVVYTWTADTTTPVVAVPTGSNLGCNPATLPTDGSVKALVTATDDCSTPTVNVVHVDVTTGCTVTRTFTVTATDGCGNTSAGKTVVYTWTADTTAPVVTIPAGSNLGCNPITLPTDASVKALVTATDDCSTPTINVAHVDVTTNCTVTRTFTVTATDSCGNAAAPQTVVYTWTADKAAPMVKGPVGSNLGCNPTNLPTDASVQAQVTTQDNCGSVTITVTHVDGGTAIAPTRTFKITATDGCGNMTNGIPVIYTWTVDTTAPVITSVPTGGNLGCNPTNLPTDASVQAQVTATDNSGSVTINVTHVDGGTTIAPTRTFTITATDGCGNVAMANPVVYTWTADTTPPTITSVPTGSNLGCNPATLPTDASVKAQVTATDNSGLVTINVTHVDGGTAIALTRTFTITATDGCGNVATASPVVYTWTVDTTAPVITSIPAGGSLGCNPANLPTDASVQAQVTATDNSGSVTINVTHVDGGTAIAPTRTFKITVTDGCGNVATANPVIYTWTADTTAPTITSVPAGSSLGCNPATLPTDASIKAQVTATDNSGSATINVTHVDGGTACAPARTFTITATDGCGNVATASPVVYTWTADTTAPTVTVPTGSNLGCNPTNPPTDASVQALVTATDICGVPTINVSHVDATSGCTVTRTFTITATDTCGNTSTAQTVVYSWKSDTMAPILYGCTNQVVYEQVTIVTNRHCIPGNFGYYPICSNQWVWFNCVLTPCTGITNKTYTVCITGQTITGTIGTSNVSLTVPDAQINYSSTCTNATTTFSNNTWVTTCPLGSTLTGDQFGSGLAYKMPFASAGGGTLNWSCNFSVPSSVPVNWKWGACVYTNLSNTYTNLGVKPVDDSTKCSYKNSDVACTPENYKQCLIPGARCGDFKNHCGNRTCPWVCNRGTNTVCTGGVVQYVPPTAVDACSGIPNVVCTPLPGTGFVSGSTNVTCTAVDDCGNVSSCTFTVSLVSPPPTITCPGNITTNTTSTSCSQVVNWTVSSSSPCGTPTTTCTPASGSTFAKGTTPVTCTAIMNGSTNNCSFTVTVNDTTKPTITCPANITTNACTAVVTFAPTVTDNCPGVTYSCTPASGSTFAQGTNTVTCTATDASGNTASASFKVMVTATAPGTVGTPTATAGTNQVVLTWPAISASAPITYSVSRSLSSGSGYSTIASGITALTYTNTGLTKGTKYYYYITATNCKGTSSSATVVNATSK
jgi:hypothetical protein